MSLATTQIGGSPSVKAIYVRLVVAGAVLGATIGFTAAQLMPTSHQEAMAKAGELAPADSSAPPAGEFDPPLWYGGRYEARQTFTGGAGDRSQLGRVMTRLLEREGWRIVAVEEAPGATLITAAQDDLEVIVHARGMPSTPIVEGIITVMYRYEPPTDVLVLASATSGAISGALGVWFTRRSLQTRRHGISEDGTPTSGSDSRRGA